VSKRWYNAPEKFKRFEERNLDSVPAGKLGKVKNPFVKSPHRSCLYRPKAQTMNNSLTDDSMTDMSVMDKSMPSVESLVDVPVEQAAALDCGRLKFKGITAGTTAAPVAPANRKKDGGDSFFYTIIQEALPSIFLIVFLGVLMFYSTFFKKN